MVAIMMLLLAADATGVIEGTVVDATSRSPLSRVSLTLQRSNSRLAGTFRTSGDGKFRFEKLEPDKYALTAERLGYLPQSYNQKDLAFGFSSAIRVGPGEEVSGLTFGMTRPAVIAGGVTDLDGRPVVRGVVTPIRLLGEGKESTSLRLGSRPTDDLGDFRIFDLLPGRYVLSVSARPWEFDQIPERDTQAERRVFPVTFFPSVTEGLAVRSGETAVANVVLRSQRPAELTLKPGPALTKEGSWFTAQLAQVGPGGTLLVHHTAGFSPEDGAVVRDVAPGEYEIALWRGQDFEANERVRLDGPATVVLGNRKPVVVRGQAAIEGPVGGRQLMIGLFSTEGAGWGYTRPLDSEGRFEFRRVMPGRHSVVARIGAESAAAAVLSADGAEIRDGQIDVPAAGTVDLRVKIRTGLHDVEGILLDDGRPIPGALVVLAPLKIVADRAAYRYDQTDTDGTFRWQSAVPGEYQVFAFPDLTMSDIEPPTRLRQFSQGQRLTVSGQAGQRVTLSPTPRPAN